MQLQKVFTMANMKRDGTEEDQKHVCHSVEGSSNEMLALYSRTIPLLDRLFFF